MPHENIRDRWNLVNRVSYKLVFGFSDISLAIKGRKTKTNLRNANKQYEKEDVLRMSQFGGWAPTTETHWNENAKHYQENLSGHQDESLPILMANSNECVEMDSEY